MGTQGMQQQEPTLCRPLGPLELIERLPGEVFATSTGRQWAGLQAHRFREQPPNEAIVSPLTHHSLLLFIRTPKQFAMRSAVVTT
jgi:hypothetical protein